MRGSKLPYTCPSHPPAGLAAGPDHSHDCGCAGCGRNCSYDYRVERRERVERGRWGVGLKGNNFQNSFGKSWRGFSDFGRRKKLKKEMKPSLKIWVFFPLFP